MKRSLKFLSLFSLTGALLFFILKPTTTDKRVVYEAFLKEEYKRFASQHIAETDAERPDQPDHAYFFNHLQTLDPATGRVPLDGLEKAQDGVLSLRQRGADQPSQVADSHNPLVWENLPADIAGRVRAITIDPVRPNINGSETTRLWAGSVTGGLWVNDNAGDPQSDWEPVTGLNDNTSISVITFDPENSDVMYIGTGESYTAVNIYRESSSAGNGIWQSTDHGETWSQLPSTTQFQYINDIVVRREGEDMVIYAAVVSGLYKGQVFTSTPSDGLFKSTDGGNSWTQVLPDIPGTDHPYSPSDIELDAIGRLFVGTMRNSDLQGAGVILHSENGNDWTVYDNFANSVFDPSAQYYPGRVIIKSAPSDPNRVYAIISGGLTQSSTGWIRDNGANSIIVQSFDQGDTWSRFALPDPALGTWSNITWHAAALAVNPIDPNEIIIGALNGFKLRNTDLADLNSANDWLAIHQWTPPNNSKYVHADQHSILYDPERPDSLFISTDGGVFFSDNAQSQQPDFSEVNKGLNTLQYYTLDMSGTAGDQFFMAGTQDNSTLQLSNAQIGFFPGSGGDGAYCFIDKDDPNLVIYSSQYNGFNVVWSKNSPSNVTGIGDRNTGIFINPADYDSRNNTLYTNRVAVNINGDNNNGNQPLLRAQIGDRFIIETILDLGTEISVPISTIKVSPFSNTGRTNLFFGTQSGRLYRVLNASDTPFIQELTGSEFPTSNISSIDIGRSEAEILVTFSNYGVNSIWYTNNAGDTWQSLEANLPDMPVRWGIFNPLDRTQIYLATELGVWFLPSTEEEIVWEQEEIGISDIRVDMIKIRKSDGWMLAASHGRGIFQTQLNVEDFVTSLPEAPALDIQTFPNPAIAQINIRLNASWTGQAEVRLTDTQGRQFLSHSFSSSEVSLNVSSLPRGIYLLTLWAEGYRKTTKRILLE